MPRPTLPRAERLSEIIFVKLRRAERRKLIEITKQRRRAKAPASSMSAIMREAFLAWLNLKNGIIVFDKAALSRQKRTA